MKNVVNIVRMDMAVCRKALTIMILSMLVTGIGCLFFLTPLLLGLFVVGSTAVISVIFSVENKSNMEFFYGCFPVRKWEYVLGRSITSFCVMAIPSVISIVFVQIGMHTSLCRNEDVREIMKMADKYQMVIMCAFIMLSFAGCANLLLASYVGKIESREFLEVVLLLIEGAVIAGIGLIIQKTVYHGDNRKFAVAMTGFLSAHEALSCILLVVVGLAFLVAGGLISIMILKKKRI